jgi:hypothetical protein
MMGRLSRLTGRGVFGAWSGAASSCVRDRFFFKGSAFLQATSIGSWVEALRVSLLGLNPTPRAARPSVRFGCALSTRTTRSAPLARAASAAQALRDRRRPRLPRNPGADGSPSARTRLYRVQSRKQDIVAFWCLFCDFPGFDVSTRYIEVGAPSRRSRASPQPMTARNASRARAFSSGRPSEIRAHLSSGGNARPTSTPRASIAAANAS